MIEKIKNINAFVLYNQAEDLEQGATYKYEDAIIFTKNDKKR